MNRMTTKHSEGVIYEFVPRGRYVKVSAIDITSGVEASIVGDASATQERLEALALQKLDWVMREKS